MCFTLHTVSNPTVVSTNWFLRSPFNETGTPTTCLMGFAFLEIFGVLEEYDHLKTV
jgi:hypothetical protein